MKKPAFEGIAGIHTDYSIESLRILLNKDCLSERFFALTDLREELIAGLKGFGCVVKSDASRLSDAELAAVLRHDEAAVRLFRRFLTIYDPSPQKFKEIPALSSDPSEQQSYRELYLLPGVRYTRAHLYYRSGYKTLQSIAETTVEEVLSKTAMTISDGNLTCIVPLPKEVRTHIAVAKAFTR